MRILRSFALAVALTFAASAFAQDIPANTSLRVRLDAPVSSATAHVGDIVPCSLASDLVVDGRVLARRGTPLRARVTYARSSGRFKSPGYVTVRLDSIDLDGRRYDLRSSAIRDEGNGHTRSNVEKIGGGTGLGALIGGLAGGGKGALLGSLAGAAGGTGLAAATGKQKAGFPAESIHDFTLTASASPR